METFPYSDGSGISIHAPREGSDGELGPLLHHLGGISIHAPREGSDPRIPYAGGAGAISIHAPREGSDGAVAAAVDPAGDNFYPRSP